MAIKPQRFRGVRQRHWGSWVSEIRHPITKIRVWLGTFHSAEDAAFVYDEAARFIGGPNAKTNFPFNVCDYKRHHYRLSLPLREKLQRSCYMEFSPTKQVTQDLSQSRHNMNMNMNVNMNDFSCKTAEQPPCRNMIDSSEYSIFSSLTDLCETDSCSTSEELEVVPSDEESNEFMNTFSEEQSVAYHDTHSTANDDYFVAEMINELLNCHSSFDLDLLDIP